MNCVNKFLSYFRALNIPVSEYTYDDVRRLTKCKMMNNPYASSIVEIEKLRVIAG